MSTFIENAAKVTAAHAALKAAIAAKGVAVPEGTRLSAAERRRACNWRYSIPWQFIRRAIW